MNPSKSKDANSRSVHFIPTSGEQRLLASAIELSQLIMSTPNQFWLVGSGCAALHFKNSQDCYSRLSIQHREAYGYYLRYSQFRHNIHIENSTYIAILSRDFSEPISLWVEGDYYAVAKSAFLPDALALRVMEHFFVTGEKSDLVEWIQDPIPYEFDDIYGEPY